MKTIAMILAGGRGKRLSILTQKRAKPAVPFAGKYRIIDFPLSNCANSGITTVGVVTQYRPRSLNDHIRIGAPWDLDRRHGGVWLLHPYERVSEMERYAGTADAIQRNFDFIRQNNPDLVLVLAGDHIYKMDYSELIDFHTAHRADVTIAALKVAPDEATRFGILEINNADRVVAFEEKPAQPKGMLASMGIYVFNLEALSEMLLDDSQNAASAHDFGRDIIPAALGKYQVFAYPYSSYWVDVGTVQAYWEAHMDLLVDEPPLNLLDRQWVIHTPSEERPPVNMRTGATVAHSLITDGCVIEGTVEYSVLSPGVRVARGAVVRNSIILTDSEIHSGAIVDRSILDKRVIVGENAHIGYSADYRPNPLGHLVSGLTVIGKNTCIRPQVRIGRNCVIAPDLDVSDFTVEVVPSGATVGRLPVR
jgi:glucose-1-phosphate adenylyltransferase